MGKKLWNISNLNTTTTLLLNSMTNLSGSLSCQRGVKISKRKKQINRINSKLKQINAQKRVIFDSPKPNHIFLNDKENKSQIKYNLFEEKGILKFSTKIRSKLKRITEDFDVESGKDLILHAIKNQSRIVLSSLEKTNFRLR